MHKRKHVMSISHAFLPALLFFLLCISFLFPALGSPGAHEYDYVDNNISNVDGAADIGAHSSFTAQQDGPDSIYDILTETDTSISDNNNIDSEIVTHGATTGISDAQTAEGTTENMTEGTPTFESYSEASSPGDVASLNVPMPSGTVEGDLLVAVFSKDSSSGTLSSPSGWTDLCELSTGGSRFLVAYKMAGAGESGPYTFSSTDSDQMACGIARFNGVDTSNPIDAQSSTQIGNTNAPQCLSATTTVDNALVLRVMGADDDDYSSPGNYPSGHSGVFTVQSTGSWGETHCAMAYVEQPSAGSTGVSSFSMTTNEQWGTITIAIAPSVDYQLDVEHVVNSIANYENYSLTTRAGGSSESFYLQMYNFTSSQWVTMSTITGSILTWYNTSFIKADFVNSTNQARIRYWQGVDATQETLHVDYSGVHGWNATNYELDLEVQWTNATFTQKYEELCIYGGTMGSENVQVDVWTGSSWQNLITDLSSGWNNISITDYLTSLTFTIRFKAATETGDISQDSWEIDCTLLHTWEVPPIANFSYTPEQPYTGESITFNASASYDPDGSIVSYFWDFGDGPNGTDEVTTHIYDDNGTYTVALTVTDNDGLSDTCLSDVTVLNRPPAASFTESAETVYTGETVNFNASDSYDPDGTIVSYFWDFGDGANSTGVVVHHAYSDDGIYTATLTVTDNDGATDSTSSTKTALNRAPTASFTESTETVHTGETITFNASNSYDPDGTIVSYFWDFGDGTNTTAIIVTHLYADNGTYTVSLTVTDDDGATATANASKTVLNRPPVASFVESAETVYNGEIITFNASSSYDPDGTIVTYFWDFGDGTNATGSIAEHAYADDEAYTVSLTVTDDDGATATATATKTILNRPPVAIFTESAETVYTGEAITFNASDSYDPDGTIVSYYWDFGDGTNATGSIVSHIYVDDGTYTVSLTVTDDDGATESTVATKTVLNRPPVASFTESAETALTVQTITFNASDSYDSDGTIISYFWDFGDGTNTIGVAVDHSYVDNGTYTVTLTVTDDDGATDSTSATKTVLNRSPVAVFTESAETVYTEENIHFNASDSYDPDGAIVSYYWDFGDGANATGIIIEHVYADNGTYTVTLTITDDDGAFASTTATKTVLNRLPVAIFTESADTVYTSELIIFNASNSYDPDGTVISYFWDFGDDTNATGLLVEHAYANEGNYTVTLTVTDNDEETATVTATKIILNRPPVATFTESAETVQKGETIYFNASGSYDPDGSIVNYFWSFGDGTNTTGITVQHSYNAPGVYIVTLTITDDDGATGTASAQKTVEVIPPVAIFTESAETVLTAETIYFNASDSYDPDGSIVNYFWSFGDGTNTTGVTVEHAYADDGNYTVTLTVTDDDGASSSTSSIKVVLNRSPVASFTETTDTVYTGETITFNASSSYDPDGTIVTYFWDFGDGTNVTGVIVQHSYEDNGTYTVTLTVTDDDGATDIATSAKTVLNTPPVVIFTESAETVYTSETITFNASDSYDPDGSIVNYFWSFGDGTNATGSVVSHAYASDAVYTVTLVVTDDDGASASANATKTVLNRSPVALFTESAETVLTDEAITFNASDSYDPDGYPVDYFWDFGDGTNATDMILTHSYVDDGTYMVTLTVTDDDGSSASTSSTKTVLNRPPAASFTESVDTVYTSEAIMFNASNSYDPDGNIISYFWDFGDGTNATGVTTEHAYSDDGNYTVTLTVTDDDGATDTTTSTKTVLNRPPVASFTESAETVYTGELITFNASASYDPDGYVAIYSWNFGDGTNTTGAVVEHSYPSDGNYTVILTVTDDDGATDTTTSTKTVLNRPPVSSFTESAETVYTGEVITFNASDSYDPDGNIISYFWDLGDGTNATGMAVEHAYDENGNYTVALTVTDNEGETASTSAVKTVLNRPPVAIFTESAETVLTGEVVTFDASDSYDPDGSIVTYFWDFGDGTNATGMTIGHAYANGGNYTVALTVTDDDGATAMATAVKTVLNRPPVAIFTTSATTVYTGEVVTFDASGSYDSDGIIVNFFWEFGDGMNATGIIVEHAYADDATYIVILTVTDDDGAKGVATATIQVLNRPPVAIFTESAETVLTGEVVTFDASGSYDPDGTIVNYFWSFGDGTNATEQIVQHAYSEDGSYTIILTVTDDDGATASTSSTKTVLNRSPVALFTESAESVLSGEVIYFNASDSYDPDGSIVSYFWDFGDGTNTTGVMVEHAYVDNGTYTVVLTVTDDDGATASTSATKIVGNKPPVALFTESAETAYTGEVIYFNASDSYDPDGSIVSYFWDFSDGTNTTGITVDHAYADDGDYSVTLTVTDDDGATASTSSTKTVLNRSPVALFTESAETAYTGEVIYFNASDSYDPDGSIVSYFWDFSDGTNTTGSIVEHAYFMNGTYTVTLTISDDDSASDATSATKTILWNEPPVALFTESAETAYTGETIYFNASESYDLDGSIVSHFWDFGDGTNATGVTTEYAYADDGNYTVVLTVTDDRGATNTAAAIKTVINRSPIASFTESGEVVYTGEIIDFNATDSYDPDGFIVFYFWDFGDGTNATDIAVSHFYTDNGTYVVTLTVIDDDDAHNSTTATKTVLNRPPVAIFSESVETIHTGQPIIFNASDSYDPDGVIVSYFWDFGDGANATGLVVEHAYSLDGSFTVTLNVIDDDGGFGVATAVKTILWNEPPVALFTESAETAYKGEIISFNASNSYDSDGNIVSYLWDFGDGTNATSMVVEHVYVSCGNYTVTLIVTDDNDATGVATAVKTILSRSPIASFTESAETAYTGEIIRFNASDSYDPDGVIVSYLWDFGDGTNVTGMIVDHAYTDDGIYTVTLVVMDDDNVSSSAGTVKTVLNRAPSASFTLSPETAYTFELITFNASDSYDTDGAIVNYFWNLGDGRTVDGEYAVIVRSYDNDESYTVTLTITDDDGATNTTTSTITVLNRPPVASFTVSAETSYAGEPITFDASDSYDLDGYIINYMWNFGDGASAGGVVVSHAYSTNGTFIATLSIMDDSKASNSTTATMTILWNELPVASFTESAETVYTSENIVFDASASYDPDGVIVSYLWDFGDGTSATGFTTSHIYVEDGNYTVSLTIKDDKGATNSISAVKTVLNRPPAISFTESAETACVNEPILFNASSCYDPDGVIVSYFWDFGDGTNATDVVVSHAYSTNGTFTVTLTVEDDDATVNSAQTTKTILASTGIHDVAVIEVTPSATEVYKRQVLNVTVVVKNEGTETENFNVTLRRAAIQGWHLVDADGHLVWFCHGESSGNFLLMTSMTIPADNPVLTFHTKYDLEFLWDFGFVQISRDAGTTWQSLENAYTTYNHDPGTDPNIIANLPGFTGNSQDWPAWITMTFNLTDYARETVILGFRYMTDTAHLEEGWYIDNVSVNDNVVPNQAFEQSNPPPANAIQTQAVANLAPGCQATLTFSWNTTTTPKGTYSIGATASNIIGETETSNNTYLNGAVKVKACPDLDGDGDVDIYDVVIVTSIYGCKEGDARWNPKADLSEDGVIDIYDVVGVTSHYGETNIYET